MSARETVIGVPISHVRMDNSSFGNPRYRVILADGRNYPTAPNASWAYGARNSEYVGVPVELTLEPCRLRSDALQIAYARPVPVWMAWNGANYSPSGAESATSYPSADAARDALSDIVANRDGMTPCADDIEGILWLYDPRESDDPYPDYLLTRTPESSHYSRDWTVTPC